MSESLQLGEPYTQNLRDAAKALGSYPSFGSTVAGLIAANRLPLSQQSINDAAVTAGATTQFAADLAAKVIENNPDLWDGTEQEPAPPPQMIQQSVEGEEAAPEVAAAAADEATDLSSLTNAELQALLAEKGLPTSGTKAELVERLTAAG